MERKLQVSERAEEEVVAYKELRQRARERSGAGELFVLFFLSFSLAFVCAPHCWANRERQGATTA